MKSFSLQFRHVVMLSFVVTLSATSFVRAEVTTESPTSLVRTEESPIQDTKVFESLIQGWNALEKTISEASNSLVELFEDIFHIQHHDRPKFNYDVTLVGFVNFADGIGRHPILFKECLEGRAKMNFVSTRNIPADIEDAQLGLPRLDPANKQDIGAVSILTDILADRALNLYTKVPSSLIKIAYTMFESTEIPYCWAKILNEKFDMAVVPDPFLINVYRNCGVKIPMFVLPLPLILHDFLKIKQRPVPHKPFVFGVTGGFWKRKNHMKVLEAFAAEFGNRSDVTLKLHGRFGEKHIIQELVNKIRAYGLTNVELIVGPYNWDEYLEFFKSLDCYVFLSMGEGFSITPREALACGKPCILTSNTAQISICNSGAVRVVPSRILVPAFYDSHYYNYHYPNSCDLKLTRNFCEADNLDLLNSLTDTDDEINLALKSVSIGYQFDCTVEDAREAMRDVYEHYNLYLHKAKQGREWVQAYLHKNLCKKYVSMVKPKTVILGTENIIGDEFLMTNSKELYEKYRYILGNTGK